MLLFRIISSYATRSDSTQAQKEAVMKEMSERLRRASLAMLTGDRAASVAGGDG
jgi:hypothetical protein